MILIRLRVLVAFRVHWSLLVFQVTAFELRLTAMISSSMDESMLERNLAITRRRIVELKDHVEQQRSTTGLSATGAPDRAAAGDGSRLRLVMAHDESNRRFGTDWYSGFGRTDSLD